MVLRRRRDTKLLPLSPLRAKLAIPMVEPSRASMADRDSDHRLLHRHLDRIPLHILPPVEIPLVGPSRIRHGPRRTSLGTDSLEYFEHGPLSAVDRRTDRKRPSGTRTVVVARSFGRSSGRR